MGPKKNKQEKAAKRKAKQFARKSREQQNGDDNDEFNDDVPKMKIQLEKLGLELKEVEGDG